MEPMSNKESNPSRRRFIKTSASLGATAVALSALGSGRLSQMAEAAVTEHTDLPVPIAQEYRRFPQRNTSFSRGVWDPAVQPVLGAVMHTFFGQNPRDEKGWTQLDYALSIAGWGINDSVARLSQLGVPNTPAFAWEGPVKEMQHRFADPDEAAAAVKRAGRFLGGQLNRHSCLRPTMDLRSPVRHDG